MSPTLNGSSHFECSDSIEIRDGIMFVFYETATQSISLHLLAKAINYSFNAQKNHKKGCGIMCQKFEACLWKTHPANTCLGMESGFWGTKMTGRWRRFSGMGTDRDMNGSKVTETLEKEGGGNKNKTIIGRVRRVTDARVRRTYLTADGADQGGLELPLELVHKEGVVPQSMHLPRLVGYLHTENKGYVRRNL